MVSVLTTDTLTGIRKLFDEVGWAYVKNNKIQVIKLIRARYGLGLKEAKDAYEEFMDDYELSHDRALRPLGVVNDYLLNARKLMQHYTEVVAILQAEVASLRCEPDIGESFIFLSNGQTRIAHRMGDGKWEVTGNSVDYDWQSLNAQYEGIRRANYTMLKAQRTLPEGW